MPNENDNEAADNGETPSQIKHPLKHTWSFWMFTNKKKLWDENLVEICKFDTVEDYWCLYHHMKMPTELNPGQSYLVFKQGIRPMWEDDANRFGGRWLMNLENRIDEIDQIWLYTVLLLIGEHFKNSDEICGVVINIKPKSKIGVWLTNSKKQKAVLEIGKGLKKTLAINGKMGFHEHTSTTHMYFV